MSASDLRGVGISAPTGFVHVSGYNRAFSQGRCGSVSEAAAVTAAMADAGDMPSPHGTFHNSSTQENNPIGQNNPLSNNAPPMRDHSRSRMRELSNIDPKFTSQVGKC